MVSNLPQLVLDCRGQARPLPAGRGEGSRGRAAFGWPGPEMGVFAAEAKGQNLERWRLRPVGCRHGATREPESAARGPAQARPGRRTSTPHPHRG